MMLIALLVGVNLTDFQRKRKKGGVNKGGNKKHENRRKQPVSTRKKNVPSCLPAGTFEAIVYPLMELNEKPPGPKDTGGQTGNLYKFTIHLLATDVNNTINLMLPHVADVV